MDRDQADELILIFRNIEHAITSIAEGMKIQKNEIEEIKLILKNISQK